MITDEFKNELNSLKVRKDETHMNHAKIAAKKCKKLGLWNDNIPKDQLLEEQMSNPYLNNTDKLML
jgi:hypothetical protein